MIDLDDFDLPEPPVAPMGADGDVRFDQSDIDALFGDFGGPVAKKKGLRAVITASCFTPLPPAPEHIHDALGTRSPRPPSHNCLAPFCTNEARRDTVGRSLSHARAEEGRVRHPLQARGRAP